jgi:hypothetical protein
MDENKPEIHAADTVLEGFSKREHDVGHVIFWMLIVGITFFFAGLIYTIADLIMPTGKTSLFILFPMGLKIIIVGAFMFGFFMLFVMFTVMYKRGTNALTKAIFSAEKMYRQIKTSSGARIVTAGLMISIFVIAVGIFLGIFQSAGNTGFMAFLESITIGETLLAIATLYLVLVTLAITFMWLWSKGTIFFQKRFFSKE